jgi:formylmethanofuran dehydrogenase subunit C
MQLTKQNPDAARVAANKRFGRFRPEEERIARKTDVKEDAVLELLKRAWADFRFDPKKHFGDDNYEAALEAVKGIPYCSSDVEKLSLALAEFQGIEGFPIRAGNFLSALINGGSDSDYVIHTDHLDQKIDFLGRRNRKKITVMGDVGSEVGYGMDGGSITVKGDAEDNAGKWMRDGLIAVEGNAGENLGFCMQGGLVVVEGDAGDTVGHGMKGGVINVRGNAGWGVGCEAGAGYIILEGNATDGVFCHEGLMVIIGGNVKGLLGSHMSGGEIRVLGDFEKLGEITGGKIYHKGKLLWVCNPLI